MTPAYNGPPNKITTAPLRPRIVPKIARFPKLLVFFGAGVAGSAAEGATSVAVSSTDSSALLTDSPSGLIAAAAPIARTLRHDLGAKTAGEEHVLLQSKGNDTPVPRKSTVDGLNCVLKILIGVL